MATAAQLLGLGARMLDLTVDYVKERRQFGVPIGSFQAVKHHLADALLRLEFARPVVYAAAWALATDDPDAGPRRRRTPRWPPARPPRVVGRQALQCHGAIGYTVEYDLHLYLKRVWALVAGVGGRVLAIAVGWPSCVLGPPHPDPLRPTPEESHHG